VHRAGDQRGPVDGQVEGLAGAQIAQRQRCRGPVERTGEHPERVHGHELGVLAVPDPMGLRGRHLSDQIDLALGITDQVQCPSGRQVVAEHDLG